MTTKQAHDALLAVMRTAFRLIDDGEGKKAARLAPDAMAALRQLDLHLTGKDGCRSQDEPRIAGAPQPPGKGWRRGCQPLRDGRWTWLLSMPPLQPPAPTCRVWKHLSERLDDLLPTENA